MRKSYWNKLLHLNKLRFLGLALIFVISLAFLYLKVIPSGRIVYKKDYSRKINFGQGFIYNLTPQERVEDEKGRLPKIIGDPVYFSVFTPRTFDSAKLSVSYYRHLDKEVPIIEAGVLADNIIWRYDLKPIENRVLDSLKSSWSTLSKDPLILQSSVNYDNEEDFLEDLSLNKLRNCPGGILECVAVYNYDLGVELKPRFSNYEQEKIIDVPLRGTHSLYIYTERTKLNLDTDFVSLKLAKTCDPIEVTISKDGTVLSSKTIEDDCTNAIGKIEESKTLSFNLESIDPGVYRVDIKISDDVVIKKIVSSSNRLVFRSRLWPVSNSEQLKLYTDQSYLFLKALGPASLQRFFFGGQEYQLSQPYSREEFFLDKADGVNEIIIEKDDVILENSGMFAFDKSALFNPQIKKVDAYFKPSEDIKYIIANYTPPICDQLGLFTQSLNLDMRRVYREQGRYNFIFSIPNLKPESGSYIEIKDIEIEFTGRNIWQKIFNF